MAHRLNIIIHFWSGADQGGAVGTGPFLAF